MKADTRKKLAGEAMLLSASLIWGLSFVFQSVVSQSIPTLTFNTVRLILAAVVMLPLAIPAFRRDVKKRGLSRDGAKKALGRSALDGALLGVFLFFGHALQQEAFVYLIPGKVGFITALYIVIVPIFAMFTGKKPAIRSWICAVIGVVALYLIGAGDGFGEGGTGLGVLLAAACAFMFASQIIFIDRFVTRDEPVTLSTFQYFFSAVFSAVAMLIFDRGKPVSFEGSWTAVIYSGVMATAVAFTLQTYGQRHTPPAASSLLLSLESVFSALFGFIFLHNILTPREIVGCALMFTAVVVTNLPDRKARGKDESAEPTDSDGS